jgi:hypothetical protein
MHTRDSEIHTYYKLQGTSRQPCALGPARRAQPDPEVSRAWSHFQIPDVIYLFICLLNKVIQHKGIATNSGGKE